MEAAESLFECLEQVPDPRRARGVRHPFQAILRLTLLGLVCGLSRASDQRQLVLPVATTIFAGHMW